MIFNEIKKKINLKNLSVEDVALKIGMSKQGLYAALNNESLRVSDLVKVAGVLEIDVREFFGEKGEKNNVNIAQNINGNNHQSIGECEEKVKGLEALLAEKERTIQILLNKS